MSIVRFSALSPAEIAGLGNNIGPSRKHRRRRLSAVNRSLAAIGEAVAQLHRSPQLALSWSQLAPLRYTRRRRG
jgi:hypothetical protein